MDTQPVIDLHVHYYTDTFVEAVQNADSIETYWRDDGRLVALWRGGVALTVPQPHPGVAQRLEMMDEIGIQTQVLSVPSPNAYFLPGPQADVVARAVNEEFAGISRDHPERFRSLAMVVMQDADLALNGLTYVLDELGMDGVMLLSNIDGVPLDDARFEPFWQAANDRSLLVYVHPTVPNASHLDTYALSIAIGFFGDTNLAISRLAYSGVFERYPAIRWVFSHLGGTLPFMFPRLDSYWRQFPESREHCPRPPTEYVRDLVFDTASKHGPALKCAVETFGLERLVFGSDFPHVPGGTKPYLEALDAIERTPEEDHRLVVGNAQTLLDGSKV